MCVLSPDSVWNEVRKYSGKNNYVLFNVFSKLDDKTAAFTVFNFNFVH